MQTALIRYTAWVDKHDLGFKVTRLAYVAMLLWAGAFKLTVPGADGIVPLVETSPLIGWLFKLFGRYVGSDIIGASEISSAILIILGSRIPKAGMAGSFIATVIFAVTSTMVITAPGSIVMVKGIGYLSFMGLFLFKDLIALGVSFFFLSHFLKNWQKTESSK
jgi:reactive chlorine resistance protein C